MNAASCKLIEQDVYIQGMNTINVLLVYGEK